MQKKESPPPSTLKSNSEIFSDIYANNVWGKPTDAGEKFRSGSGSHDEKIIVPYINTLLQLLTNNGIRNIVDLGCGDFWIMRHVLGTLAQNKYNFFYTGIDVVADLINYNAEHFRHPNIRFVCRDVTIDNEPLPDGDILIIRQVLQHLSNADIKKILDKASKFKFLFVTESIYGGVDAVHNIDKASNNHTRVDHKSGVYLEHAPFAYKNIVHLLEVRGGVLSGIQSTIRSSLIIN